MKLTLAAFALIASTGLAMADHDTMDHAHGDHVHAGQMTLSGGFTRATLPNQPVGGGYVTLTNDGPDDRLVSAQSPVAGEVQIHEMAMQGGVMKMRQLVDGLAVLAGKTVELKPGGYHLMFMQLKEPLVEGTKVPVTLTFEHAGTVSLELPVRAPNAKSGGMDHSAHMEHSHGEMN